MAHTTPTAPLAPSPCIAAKSSTPNIPWSGYTRPRRERGSGTRRSASSIVLRKNFEKPYPSSEPARFIKLGCPWVEDAKKLPRWQRLVSGEVYSMCWPPSLTPGQARAPLPYPEPPDSPHLSRHQRAVLASRNVALGQGPFGPSYRASALSSQPDPGHFKDPTLLAGPAGHAGLKRISFAEKVLRGSKWDAEAPLMVAVFGHQLGLVQGSWRAFDRPKSAWKSRPWRL